MTSVGTTDTVILCGGLGLRLRPVTGETPKGLAQVDGRPFLDLLMGYAAGQGMERFILCTGYGADEIERYFGHRDMGDVSIEFSREEEPLGTGGALKRAWPLIKSDPFLVMNGDSFCSFAVRELLESHRARDALVTMVLGEVDDAGDYGTVVAGDDGKLESFREKVEGKGKPTVSGGIYLFSRTALGGRPARDRFSLEEDFFPGLVGRGLYGHAAAGVVIDIGTPERYERARRSLEGTVPGRDGGRGR